jgi:hypothetical protein
MTDEEKDANLIKVIVIVKEVLDFEERLKRRLLDYVLSKFSYRPNDDYIYTGYVTIGSDLETISILILDGVKRTDKTYYIDDLLKHEDKIEIFIKELEYYKEVYNKAMKKIKLDKIKNL